MIYIALNAAPILAATLAALLVGLVYRTMTGQRSDAGLLVTAALAEAWLASILAGALILAPVKAGGWTVALGTAVIIWGGFVLPATLVTLRARGVRWPGALADCAQWLAAMLVMAAVLHTIGLIPPPR